MRALLAALPLILGAAIYTAIRIGDARAQRRHAWGRARDREIEAGLERFDHIRATEGEEAADSFAERLRERFKDRPAS